MDKKKTSPAKIVVLGEGMPLMLISFNSKSWKNFTHFQVLQEPV